MTTIGIDCRFAATGTGLGRYTRELVTVLLARSDPWRTVLFIREEPTWLPAELHAACAIVPAPFPHYSIAEHTRFPTIMRGARIDLFFAPHFNVPLQCPVPFVATIHDLILHRFPNRQSFFKRAAYRYLMKSTVRNARHLIAVSNFTMNELASVYGNNIRANTSVIHEAVSPLFCPAETQAVEVVRARHRLTRPFFLYVGNAKEHKNVQLLIDAFTQARVPEHELLLVCGGKEVENLRIAPGVRVLRDVPDADLPALYTLATSFVSASLYEGFGLPLLESAACGCPAIVTNRAAFPEIAPHGTQLIEPTVTAFVAAFHSPPPRSTERPALRSWKEVADETARVLADSRSHKRTKH